MNLLWNMTEIVWDCTYLQFKLHLNGKKLALRSNKRTFCLKLKTQFDGPVPSSLNRSTFTVSVLFFQSLNPFRGWELVESLGTATGVITVEIKIQTLNFMPIFASICLVGFIGYCLVIYHKTCNQSAMCCPECLLFCFKLLVLSC